MCPVHILRSPCPIGLGVTLAYTDGHNVRFKHFFQFSEAVTIISLMLSSVLMSVCLRKASKRSLKKTTQRSAQNIELQRRNHPDTMNILHGDDKSAIRRLIKEENSLLKTMLLIINMKGSGTNDRAERRKVNKTFLDYSNVLKNLHDLPNHHKYIQVSPLPGILL